METTSHRRCNICLQRRKMSSDHIFPQSISKKEQKRITSLGQRLGIKDSNSRTRLTQNGFTAKTICEKCNNNLLGARLDLALKELHQKLDAQLRYLKFLSHNSLHVEGVNLGAAIRAASAHLLAFSDIPNYRSDAHRALRRLALRAELDPKLRVVMWVYPYSDQVLIDSISKVDIRKEIEPVFFIAYKTYPLAFAFIYDSEEFTLPSNALFELTKISGLFSEKSFRLQLPAKPTMSRFWPEAPFDYEIMLSHSKSGINTQPYMNTKPYKY